MKEMDKANSKTLVIIFVVILVIFLVFYGWVWCNRIGQMKNEENKKNKKPMSGEKITTAKNSKCLFCNNVATQVRILDPDAPIPSDIYNGEILLQLSEAEKMTVYSCEDCKTIAGTFRTSKWIELK